MDRLFRTVVITDTDVIKKLLNRCGYVAGHRWNDFRDENLLLIGVNKSQPQRYSTQVLYITIVTWS